MSLNGIGCFRIDCGKSLQIAFRVSCRYAGHARCGRANAGTAPRDEPLLLTKRREPQPVRILLRPFNATLCAIDAQTQRIFIAGRNLAASEHSLRAAFKTQHHMGIVVQAASLDKTV
ncbi:hypothetical protein B995_00264 [Brucella abortus F1/06-B21]|nr:hypothetical protein B995_00264 [Brucella abortus F1/06-B21]